MRVRVEEYNAKWKLHYNILMHTSAKLVTNTNRNMAYWCFSAREAPTIEKFSIRSSNTYDVAKSVHSFYYSHLSEKLIVDNSTII